MKTGTKVFVNGQTGTILGEYLKDMYEVRIWDGSRHVGDIVVPSNELKCVWCHDAPIKVLDLCQTCYALSA